jgi:hypothetical protein
MDAAGKLGAARVAYGSAPEIARARVRAEARFGVAPANVARGGETRSGTAAPEKPRSAHAERSAAQNLLLQAQEQATPALERLPTALRARVAGAHLPTERESAPDAAAEAVLNRLRDDGRAAAAERLFWEEPNGAAPSPPAQEHPS